MSKWIAEFDLEDGDRMPEHMDLNYKGARIHFHCRPLWISVIEKLPEDHKDVLAYLSSDRISICRYNSHKLPFCNNPIGWSYLYGAGYIDFEEEKVIAWMPLPEPFKADMREAEE